MSAALMEATAKVVDILSPLEPDQRKRVIHAAFALIGEPSPVGGAPAAASLSGAANGANTDDYPGISPVAVAWLSKSKITIEQLEQHLHFDEGNVKVISLPGGATKRIDQVINTYLMLGFASFLEGGSAAFTDKDARDLCEYFGCYDHTNHAKYLKEFGNKIAGSKGAGWKLTTPGIAAAGELVRI